MAITDKDVEIIQKELARLIPAKAAHNEKMIKDMTRAGEPADLKFDALLTSALDFLRYGN